MGRASRPLPAFWPHAPLWSLTLILSGSSDWTAWRGFLWVLADSYAIEMTARSIRT